MVYNNTLTASQKDKKIPVIIRRDGNVCFFCKQPFHENVPGLGRVVAHCNDKPTDGRVENLVVSHESCNEEMKDNIDYKIIALDHLKKNVSQASESLSERERINRTDTGLDELTEGQVNQIINKIVKLELETQLPPKDYDRTISYNKTLKGVHYLVIEQTGGKRGSEVASRRSLDAFCSQYAPWLDEKQGKGNRIIRRRMPEEYGK